MIIVKNW